MIGDGIPFAGDDALAIGLAQLDALDAIMTDVRPQELTAPTVVARAEGMLTVAASIRSRVEATLDQIDPDWRQVRQALAEMTGGTP